MTGVKDELLAVKRYDETVIGAKHVVVVYKEQGQDALTRVSWTPG